MMTGRAANTARGDHSIYAPFPATQWSLVVRAVDVDVQVKREALSALLRLYHPALRSFLTKVKRVPPDRADDLVQGFLACKLIEEDLIRRASRERGKFRTLLLTALNNFMVSQIRGERARKRAPDDLASWEDQFEPVQEGAAPDARFDVEWARQLLAEAQRRMEEQCRDSGREDVWGVFVERLLLPILHDAEPMPYEELVQRFNLKSPAQASNVLITGRRMYERILRGLICDYAGQDADVEEEIADLYRALSRAGA